MALGVEGPLSNSAKLIVTELRDNMVRTKADFGSDPIKAKIANPEQAKVHTLLAIGGRDPAVAGQAPQVSGFTAKTLKAQSRGGRPWQTSCAPSRSGFHPNLAANFCFT